MTDRRHTRYCVGGPLDGQRYDAPNTSGTFRVWTENGDVRYVAVAVPMRDGPVTFWAPEGSEARDVAVTLLTRLGDDDTLATLVARPLRET